MLQLTKPYRSSLPLIAVLIAILLTMSGAPAQANSPAAPPNRDLTPSALAGAVSPEGLLNPDGTLDMSAGFQGTLDLRGWEVILDGERGPVLKPASRPAAPQVTAWNGLPNQGLGFGLPPVPGRPLGPTVEALALVGSDLFVGGNFTRTGDGALTNLGFIARYDTVTGTWNALPNQGLNERVQVLAVIGSDLYVGGYFTQTGDGALTSLGRMARYDTTAGTWNALPHQGLGGGLPPGPGWPLIPTAEALALVGSDLFVGGNFTRTGDGALTNLGFIARYDTVTGTWNALPHQGLGGVSSPSVRALVVSGSDLYVGGYFTQTGDGALTNLGRIARYDTTAGTWNTLPSQGLGNTVLALAMSGSDLYVGGYFAQTGDGMLTGLGHIARYSSTAGTWNTLPSQGLDNTVRALAMSGSDLYVGGYFAQTGDGMLTDLGCIAHGGTYYYYAVYLPLVIKQ